MKVVLVTIDNGQSYEDNCQEVVIVCANMEKAQEYIISHPITEEVYKEYFHTIWGFSKGKYYTQWVEVYQ